MKKRISLFLIFLLLIGSTFTVFADSPSLNIQVGKGSGYHQGTNGRVNNVILTKGIAVSYGVRKAPIIYVQSYHTHPYNVSANTRAYQTSKITSEVSNPFHGHKLLDTGMDEY